MNFDTIPKSKVAGSAYSILQNDAVRNVFSLFGDKCLDCYNIDIRTKKTFMSARVLRQVQSFVNEYGEEDAIKIIEKMFSPRYEGKFRGDILGTSIFAKNMRWLANKFLLEKAQDGSFADMFNDSKWD